MTWITKARRLRAENKSMSEIAAAVGVHKSRIGQVLKGTKHVRGAWHEHARRMRATGASIQQIVDVTGKATSTVVEVVKDVTCPINHRIPGSEKRAFSPSVRTELPPHLKQEIVASIEALANTQEADYRRNAEIQQVNRLKRRSLAEKSRQVQKMASSIGKRHGFTAQDLLEKKSKVAPIVRAREELVTALRTQLRMTTIEIGKALGHADHTTVLKFLQRQGLSARLDRSATL